MAKTGLLTRDDCCDGVGEPFRDDAGVVCREDWRDGAGVLGSERFGDALARDFAGMMVVESSGCGQMIEKWMLRVK